MTPQEFIAKWKHVTLSERSACQQHFLDVCEVLGQPKPAAADPDGAWYTFERGVRKSSGGRGWADVWMRDHFGWEYKGKHKDLRAAYNQLLQYKDDLENPPLLVVCDMDRFEVQTNFTGTVTAVHHIELDGLADPQNLDILRKVFTDPYALKPGLTTEGVTKQAAELIGQLADGMRVRDIPALQAAHFLMKLMFCMFAEDIDLLPGKVFSRVMETATKGPGGGMPDAGAGPRLSKLLRGLFESMSQGGLFGTDDILHFNGGLFADADVIDLTPGEILKLRDVSRLDWSSLEPSIFGTLFERTLDPEKRAQIGAHYTGREDIQTLLEPVVMQSLRREWEAVQAKCEQLTADVARAKTPAAKRKKVQQRDKTLRDLVERLAHVTILDPACGSGNFLYVALHLLLDLEKQVITYAAHCGIGLLPQVRPTQLAGIEINAPNSDVVRPWANGLDITRRSRGMWIIDFGPSMTEDDSAPYEAPFEHAKHFVKKERQGRREQRIVDCWWRFGRPRVEMRNAIRDCRRYLVTPAVAKHRLFVWLPDVFVPDQQLLVYATDDGMMMGVLHSRAHEIWARSQGTQVRERESGFRYTPTTCFETFPFPEPTDSQREAIASAAKELDELRSRWLNPPEWTRTEVLEFPGSADGPWKRYLDPATLDERGIGTVRYPRLVPKDEECARQLKKRTLTNLYNERPTWLDLAHKKLDAAVFAAYGWDVAMTDDELLAALLELNLRQT